MLFSESFYFLQENFNVWIEEKHKIIDVPFFSLNSVPMFYEGALASFLNSALGFSPTLFLQLPRSCIPCINSLPLNCTYARVCNNWKDAGDQIEKNISNCVENKIQAEIPKKVNIRAFVEKKFRDHRNKAWERLEMTTENWPPVITENWPPLLIKS